MNRRKRLEMLEEQSAAWEAAHMPLSHVAPFLLAVLETVSEEAGPQTAGRVAGRLIGEKLRRIEVLRVRT